MKNVNCLLRAAKLLGIFIIILTAVSCDPECKTPQVEECIIEVETFTCFCMSKENPDGITRELGYCDGYSAISQTSRTTLETAQENLCRRLKQCD